MSLYLHLNKFQPKILENSRVLALVNLTYGLLFTIKETFFKALAQQYLGRGALIIDIECALLLCVQAFAIDFLFSLDSKRREHTVNDDDT